MSQLGEERYHSRVQHNRNIGKETRYGPAKKLLQEAVKRFMEYSDDFLAAEKKKGRGRKHHMVAVFAELKPSVIALVTAKTVLDRLTQEQDWNRLVYAVGQGLEDEIAYKKVAKEHPALWKHTRANYSPARVREGLKYKAGMRQYWTWSTGDRYKAGLWCLHVLVDTSKLFLKTTQRAKKNTRYLLRPTEETLKWLKNADDTWEALSPFYLPTTGVPKDWQQGKDGGYVTPLVHTKTFVKTYHRVAEKLLEDADLSLLDRAVNNLQRVGWQINPKVSEVLVKCLTSDQEIIRLPSVYQKEIPKRPDGDDPEQWQEWKIEAGKIHRENLSNTGKFMKAQTVRGLVQRFQNEMFYYPQRLDFRGRVYPLPNYLNLQGDDMCRGLLQFARREPIEGSERYLAIHTANVFGFDKSPLKDRLEWYYTNHKEIRRAGQDPMGVPIWADAAEPWQALAACVEVSEYHKVGKRFLTGLPLAIDCTNNGLQLYALLMRDPVGAYWTNCSDEPDRKDIYAEVAKITKVPEALAGFLKEVPRNCAKRPVMTLSYGSTRHSCQHYVRKWYEEAYPVDPLSGRESFHALLELADNLWQAMEERIGRPLEAMEWLRDAARLFSQTGIEWISPTGLPVYQRREHVKSMQAKTRLGDSVKVARYRKFTGKIHVSKMMDAFPPNYIHSLDAAVVHKTAASFTGPLGTVHDSFSTLAPHVARLGQEVREAVVELFSQDLLGDLKSQLERQLGQGLPDLPEYGDFDVREVLRSTYFCS